MVRVPLREALLDLVRVARCVRDAVGIDVAGSAATARRAESRHLAGTRDETEPAEFTCDVLDRLRVVRNFERLLRADVGELEREAERCRLDAARGSAERCRVYVEAEVEAAKRPVVSRRSATLVAS